MLVVFILLFGLAVIVGFMESRLDKLECKLRRQEHRLKEIEEFFFPAPTLSTKVLEKAMKRIQDSIQKKPGRPKGSKNK